MDEAVIVCIKSRYYVQAANLIVKGILGENTHKLGQLKRDRITKKVARMIKDKHEYLRSWYADMNIKPRVIAEEVYNDIMLELVPESSSHESLSEQMEEDEQ